MRHLTLPFAALIALSACGEAPDNSSDKIEVTGQSAAKVGQPAPAEARGQDFVSSVLGSYAFSLESARLAEQKADRAAVKQFATQLRSDLESSQAELTRLASGAGLRMEPTPGETHQTDLAVLSSTRGAPLERAFAEQQMEGLTALVGLLRAYKNGGDNLDLKAWADKAQRVVGERLMDVQTLNGELQEAADKPS
jgi:putative membrane protein